MMGGFGIQNRKLMEDGSGHCKKGGNSFLSSEE